MATENEYASGDLGGDLSNATNAVGSGTACERATADTLCWPYRFCHMKKSSPPTWPLPLPSAARFGPESPSVLLQSARSAASTAPSKLKSASNSIGKMSVKLSINRLLA